MSPEAQQAAVHRLAWCGRDERTISAATGICEADIRRIVRHPGNSGNQLRHSAEATARRAWSEQWTAV
jgi:hypothetical protein